VPYKEEDKEEGEKDTVALPNYCSYFHVQFWGKKFPQEFSRSPLGFVMRRKFKEDLRPLTSEFKKLFNDTKMKVITR